jgi:hypothetical protein
MNHALWWIISFAVGFAVFFTSDLLGIPIWVVLAVVVPLAVIGMTVYSFLYNVRPDLKVEVIPTKGFGERMRALEVEAAALEKLGFRKVDEFYLKIIPDCIVQVFGKEDETLHVFLYHLGQKMSSDVITAFKNDYNLTTGASADGGNIPPSPKDFLQTFDMARYERLLEEHGKAIEFLKSNRLEPQKLSDGMMRDLLLKSFKKLSERVRQNLFWPILLIYWVISKRGRMYARSIEEQYKLGIIKLP